MESADDAKYISDLDEDKSSAEVSFGHFLDENARDDGRFMDMISAAALPLVVNAVLRG
jgi:hypothetical protein